MVGWPQQLNGHEFEQILGDGKGQGSLVYCSPWGHKESDTTQQLNWEVLWKKYNTVTNDRIKRLIQMRWSFKLRSQ